MLSIYNFLKVKLCYRTYWKQWLTLLAICLLVFACSGGDGGSDDPNNPCPNQPQLTTLEVSNIIYDENTDLVSATFTGEIQNIQLGANCETFSITNQGFVYGTNIQPTTSDNVVNANGENALVTLNDLATGTTYYVRAYLTNTLGTFYGNEVSFTTPQSVIPIYLDENGITIVARSWAEVGMSEIINGITYTVVDESVLRNMIQNNEDVSVVCTSLVNNMDYLFYTEYTFNQDISTWDVSNVTNMSSMFRAATSFNQDISSWDVSSVTEMAYMFHAANSFNQNISNWNVSSVTNMEWMFTDTVVFNQDISSWNVNNVTTMKYMFHDANAFNQDISSWDVSNTTDMYAMFSQNEIFNQDISSWDVSNVTDMTGMFSLATVFNQDLSSWNVASATICVNFCSNATNWTLPKPNFTNCSDDLGCD